MKALDVMFYKPDRLASRQINGISFMRYFLILLVITLAFACSSDKETVEVTDKDSGMVELFERSRKSGLREGFYRKFDAKGVMIEEATFKNDVFHGKRKLFDEAGRLLREENHDQGHYHGPYKTFYPDGALDSEGVFEMDEMIGVWKRYYPNGQLMEEVAFARNLENGPFKEWYENGKPRAEGAYLEGDNEHGLLIEYDTTGTLEARKMCERGICKTIWTREGGNIE